MKKQITGGVVLSLISQGISIVIGLVYTPIMIRILGQNEYGLYQLVQSVVNYLNLMNFGFNGAYIRYYSIAKAKDDEQEIANINGMFMKVFLFIATLCLLGGIVLYLNIRVLGNHLTEADYIIAKELLIIMVINLAISFPASLYSVYMSANERFIFPKGIGIIINILIPLLTLPLLWLGYGSIGVVSITLFLSVLRLGANLWYCAKKLHMKVNMRYVDRSIFQGLLGYTFFIFLSDVVDQLNTNVDKYLLGRMIGTVSVAIYSVGFNLKHYYTIVSWIIPEMFIPEANRLAIEEKDDKKLTVLFTKIGRYNNFILLLVLTGFFLVGKPFIRLWVGPEYDNAYYVCMILMLAGYIPAIQTLGVNIQNAKNMHRIRSIVYFGIACVNVVISVFLIRKWGEIGTSIGTFGAVFLGSGLFMNYYYHKHLGLNIFYFWKKVLKWTIPAMMIAFIAWLALKDTVIDSWIKLFGFVCAYSLVYIVALWFIGLHKNEKEIIKTYLKKSINMICRSK